MGALLMGAARWVIGGVLKWGTIGSVAGGVGSTVISGQDLNATNIARNTASTAKDIAGAAGDFVSEIIAPTPAPTTNGSTQPGTSGSGPSAQNPGASAGTQAASAISSLFNNFSDTKLGRMLEPVKGFFKDSPWISFFAGLGGLAIAASGSNGWFMRLMGLALASFVGLNSGLLDSVTQGSGAHTPSVGGADMYQTARQPHTGGAPVVRDEEEVTVDINNPNYYVGPGGIRPAPTPS